MTKAPAHIPAKVLAWLHKQPHESVMSTKTFKSIERKAAKSGYDDPQSVAGEAYWKTVIAKYRASHKNSKRGTMKRKVTPAMKVQQEIIKRTGKYRSQGMTPKAAYQAAKKEYLGKNPGVFSRIKEKAKGIIHYKKAHEVRPVKVAAVRRLKKKLARKKNPGAAWHKAKMQKYLGMARAEEKALLASEDMRMNPRKKKRIVKRTNPAGKVIRKGTHIEHAGAIGRVAKSNGDGTYLICWYKGGRKLYDTVATEAQIRRALK